MAEHNTYSIERKLTHLTNLVNKLIEMMDPIYQKPDRWITTKEAAALLRCSPQAVRVAIRQGKLKARHEGRAYFLSEGQIQKIIGYK